MIWINENVTERNQEIGKMTKVKFNASKKTCTSFGGTERARFFIKLIQSLLLFDVFSPVLVLVDEDGVI